MPNILITRPSPYLQQHADNPVDWHEWSPETLVLSRDSGKPILLSIGYSACHWCHVMAHESFEDEDVAARTKSLFCEIQGRPKERAAIGPIFHPRHSAATPRSRRLPPAPIFT